MTEHPLKNNSYNKVNNIYIDTNFEEIGSKLISFLKGSKRILFFSVYINEQIYGNSYEMAMVMLLLGYDGISATGTLQEYDSERVTFGKILGLQEKKKYIKNLLHEGIIKTIPLSPY